MKKLRILQAIYCLGRGGAERLAIDITRELNKSDNVEALLISFDKTVNYEYSTDDINYKYCPSSVELSISKKTSVNLKNYFEVINDFKPNIIHSHRFQTEIITREKIYPEIAYFTHMHDNIEQFQNLSFETLFNKTELLNFFEKQRLLKRYHRCHNNFIAISKDAFDYTIKTLPKSLHNIVLLNNAIDFHKFNASSHKRIINKNEKIKLVSIGNLFDKKNHIFLIDVVKTLKEKGYDISLDILGEGSNFQMLNNKLISENLEKDIFLRGNVENVEEYLFNSHIYVHSALYEPFGLVILEAMAAGLPCVTLDGKGNRDIINDRENGYIIYDLSPLTFADRIIELIEQKETYDKISGNSINTAKAHDMSGYIDKLLDHYYSVLNK